MDIEYSSDDSLVWTNASSDSESSTEVVSNMKQNNCESESDYKTEVHDELVNGSDGKKHKKKAKKRRHDEDLSDDDHHSSTKKKKIKIEPESDKDKSEAENIANSESYVNLRIKQEDSHSTDNVKSKKKKKHKKDKQSIDDTEAINGTANNDSTLQDTAVEEIIKKKKKKKKSKHSDSDETETTKKRHSYTTENDENEQSDERIHDKRKRVISSTFIENDTNDSRVDETIINDISAIPSLVSKKTTRISDRLQFEDDENITKIENRHEEDESISISKDVKSFLKSDPTLIPISTFTPFNMDEDDVWILKCPTEININDLKGVNLASDGKSKIKIAGQTYDGTFDEVDCKQPIVTYSKKRMFLKNMSVLKTITFRKRIPVLHIQDDNIAMNEHNSFIPLPDTKSRHPLFGTNYKKAIKVRKSVGERLAVNDSQSEVIEEEIYKKKKKKHKKEKNSVEKEEVKATIVKEEVELPVKAKKRKHKVKEESDVKPAKRIKLEQNPETWESEKAIEANLFNF